VTAIRAAASNSDALYSASTTAFREAVQGAPKRIANFRNVRKVDTHLHHSACMGAESLLEYACPTARAAKDAHHPQFYAREIQFVVMASVERLKLSLHVRQACAGA